MNEIQSEFKVVTVRGKSGFVREYPFEYLQAARNRFEKYKENDNISVIKLKHRIPDPLDGGTCWIDVDTYDRAFEESVPRVIYNCYDVAINTKERRRDVESMCGLDAGTKWVEIEWIAVNGETPFYPADVAAMMISQMDLQGTRPYIVLPNVGTQAVEVWKQVTAQTKRPALFCAFIVGPDGKIEEVDVL